MTPPRPTPLLDAAIAALRRREARRALALVSRALVHEGEAQGQGLAVLGAALRAADLPHAALETLRAASARRPTHLGLAYQHARAAHDLGLLDEARAGFERCLRLAPAWSPALSGLGETLLTAGDWARGWAALDQGNRPENHKALPLPPPERAWDGRPLAGRRLLVIADQGYGDMVQFCRLLPPLAARAGGPVLLGCPPSLARLLGRIPGLTAVFTRPPPAHAFDCFTVLSRLPLHLGLKETDLPGPVPYLRPPPTLARRWAGRVEALARPRVALAWAGRPRHARDHRRSLPLAALAPLACVAPFVALSPLPDSGSPPPLALCPVMETLDDFAETAGLLHEIDLLISVDTAVAHLAGALNRPVWILLPFTPDWRWRRERVETPWYPSARLIRQPMPGDWASVLARVRDLLTRWHAGSPHGPPPDPGVA
ncbi:glycosyltransferase family 9 protein [Pararhodospirillum oryzae]|uniref:Uncharacterized protein n=1 Tax=Pararhodospirillum oryzae TaxID=478448 RepID=A0A512H3J1_9PROT|nr:tetratricopeptide repeat-containing glycosyltransferase family protein [Pararhodospirillum oryzae]GEO79978.1 hypothetical protein ROR02_01090 [Pararhodospirillum oryzae]